MPNDIVSSGRPSNASRKWNSTKLTAQWQTLDIDLTPYIPAPGQYEVEFRKTEGSGSLDVQDALAIMAGTESPHLITQLGRPHAWNINRTAQVTSGPKGRTAMRVKVRVASNAPWKDNLISGYATRPRWLARTIFDMEGAFYPHVLYAYEPTNPALVKSPVGRQYIDHVWGFTLGVSGFTVQPL